MKGYVFRTTSIELFQCLAKDKMNELTSLMHVEETENRQNVKLIPKRLNVQRHLLKR